MKKRAKRVSQKLETVSTTTRPAARAKKAAESPSPSALSAPLIVGIGASAGGLEAFTQLLHALPTNTGMAFVLVQHLEPKHESVLTTLLARATTMPVHEVREGMRVEPNHVYVIPSNADLSMLGGLLHIVRRKAPAGRHLPIDYFFRSLAETQGARAVGVILSGTASDGTAGIKAVKEAGGVTFAEDPESAKFDGMPRSAIATGCVDFVLPPERIAKELARIVRHPFLGLLPLDAIPTFPAQDEEWARLFRLLRTATGVDFSLYKKSTIKRRLARRMALNKVDRLSAYLKILERKRTELDALFEELLILVTEFFRDPDAFLALQKKIFSQILKDKPAGEPIRIWCAGCSSGEEAYSIAISLLEYLKDNASSTPIQIFGTDVSENAIEKARMGIYSERQVKGVSKERLRRFFTWVNSAYQVNQSIREMCVFACHDLTRDPPFSKLDLVSCRNVLIYMEPALQERVLAAFHYGLKSGGILLLGKSESLGAHADLFTVTDRKLKVFKKNVAAHVHFKLPQRAYRQVPPGKPVKEVLPAIDLEKEADQLLWERSAYAGLVVNSDLQILHFRGDVSPYLRPVPGKASLQLMRILREDIVLEVRAIFQKARRSGRVVRSEGIEIRHNHHTSKVNVEVRPLAQSGPDKSFLILFEPASPASAAPAKPAARPSKAGKEQDREVLRLRDDLARTKEYVKGIIRDEETSNEELKTANEEALSSMEELQSTNEELETAKEELQSANEELVTLNEQLENRNAELTHLSNDLSNFLSGVDIPIVILGPDLRIRRFTSAAEKLLGLIPGDVGRPISKLRIGIQIPGLEDLIPTVAQGSELVREVQSESGRWWLLRMSPFRTGNDKIEGVLIAFVDIDQLKQQQGTLQRDKDFIAAILDAAKDLLVVILDREGRIVHFNRVCQQLTGYSLQEVQGRHLWDFLIVPEEVESVQATFREVLRGKPVQRENHWVAKDGRRLLISCSHSAALSDGQVQSVIKTGINVSARAEARQRARESEATIRALLENTLQAILACDKDGRIMLVNAGAEKMYGYGRDELIGHALELLLPERLREAHVLRRAAWFAEPRTTRVGLELAGLRKDGSEFPIEVQLSSVGTQEGMLCVAFVSDITERKKNEGTLLQYKEQLQKLTGALLEAQESGNREVARELHDVFSQELASVGMEISFLKVDAKSGADLTERLSDLGKKIARLAADIHRTSRELHPAILEELGLEPALQQECESFRERFGIPIEFTAEAVPAGLPNDVALCLYRVAQEGLRNIQKHAANSEAVRASLTGSPEGITLRIEDSGDGFDLDEARKKGGLGLISIEERVRLVNGKLTIQSQPGKGTTIKAFAPLEKKPT